MAYNQEGEQQAGPSQDAIASLITQVSPTGQPARAPARPNRPRQGTKRTASTAGKKPATTSVTPNSPTTPSSVPPAIVVDDNLSSQAPIPADQNNAQLGEASEVQQTTSTRNNDDTPTTEESNKIAYPAAESSSSNTLPPANAPSANDVAAQPSAAAAAIPPTARSTAQQLPKKKRKGFLASLFGSCMSSSSHDDDQQQQSTSGTGKMMTERKPGQANATRPTGASSNKLQKSPSATGAAVTSAGTGGVAMVDLNKGSKNERGVDTIPNTDPTGPSAVAATSVAAAAELAIRNALAAEGRQGGGSNIIQGGSSTMMPSTSASVVGQQHPPSDIAPEVLAANQRGGAALPRDETADVLSGAVQAPGSEGLTPKKEKRRKSSGEASSMLMQNSESNAGLGDESHVSSASSANGEDVLEDSDDEYMDEDERLIAQGGIGIPVDEYGNQRPLLVELSPSDMGRKCLVLDLDETLVHSSFKLVHAPDFIVPVEIENQVHNVYVLKRPGVDAFMKRMGEIYEVVIFTASLSKYADPVLDKLDIHQVVKHRLFRESCYNHKGNYVKDLSQLGRPIGETIIIDNSPASYIFHPNNAVPVSSWFNDPHDTELTDLQHFLADLANVPDVRGVLDGGLYPVPDGLRVSVV